MIMPLNFSVSQRITLTNILSPLQINSFKRSASADRFALQEAVRQETSTALKIYQNRQRPGDTMKGSS